MLGKRVVGDAPVSEKGTARAWCYTIFLPDGYTPEAEGFGDGQKPDEEVNEETSRLRYFIAQREVCPDTQRVHWQCYGEFNSPVKGSAALKAIRVSRGDQRFRGLRPGEIHWERRRGRREQARDYCRKTDSRDPRDGSGPFEWGMFCNQFCLVLPCRLATCEALRADEVNSAAYTYAHELSINGDVILESEASWCSMSFDQDVHCEGHISPFAYVPLIKL